MIEKPWHLAFELLCISSIVVTTIFHGSVSGSPPVFLYAASLALIGWLSIRLFLVSKAKLSYPTQLRYVLVFFIIAIFQIIPLPVSILQLFSPTTVQLYEKFLPGFSHSSWHSISIYTLPTKYKIIESASLISLFFVASNAVREKGTFQRLFASIVIFGTLIAIYSLMKQYLISGTVESGTRATFGNKNHFAAFMTMIAPLSVGFALSIENHAKKFIFLFFSALITTSIFLSLSRAGSISVIFSFFVMLMTLKKGWRAKEKIWATVLGCALVLALLAGTGIGPLQERFQTTFSEGFKSDRFLVAQDSLKIIRDFPVFGIGLGNFQYIFTIYKSFVSYGFYRELHNDHLQMLVEAGIIAFFFYYLFLFTIFKSVISQLKTRRDPFVLTTAIGVLCGLLGVLVHSFFDFNFQIPAISCLFWLLLGIVYKIAHTHFEQ